MSDEIINNLGPLAPLAGVWESDKGVDVSRIHGKETTTKFREKIVFEPLGPVNNGPQALYGLRYSTLCWRLNEVDPFHEELGYWLWDKDRNQVLRSFTIPRGVVVNAGGYVEEDSKSFRLEAELGSETYGILSNRYLDDSYKTKRYYLEITINDDNSFSYKENTQLWIPIDQAIFDHTDQNVLKKV
ncbi:MAG: FABP family protein [gamma proteobacterium symbiont of Bathyaustriella thionipta]|nr:FABP family protein [gamma proteobacterium symbiont of Bathyaustriella thionipta]MCU7951195.1 FABP family protein [gamma proteobacterium symbiont of Bathyaustriella thionipta]MCU7952372.1 FABP family protein [gamma proteobacterium symbiont of Bathyaustriella thionipta]MCU7957700.1 FABP family protein [gamma proteobacterium symbiont of Bathyaustriella thionipta]MCU7967976.1 FABP family protein [gamma proteobacterium symbiont of Bathyaustriella thionipta]